MEKVRGMETVRGMERVRVMERVRAMVSVTVMERVGVVKRVRMSVFSTHGAPGSAQASCCQSSHYWTLTLV